MMIGIKKTEQIVDNIYIDSIRKTLISITPLLVIGSICQLIVNWPMQGYQGFMQRLFGVGWFDVLEAIFSSTYGMVCLYVVWEISCKIALASKVFKKYMVNPRFVGCVSVSGFLFMNFYRIHRLSITLLGPQRVFAAIIGAIGITWLFEKSVRFFTPKKLNYNIWRDIEVRQALTVLVPVGVTFVVLSILHIFLSGGGLQYFSTQFYSILTNIALEHKNSPVFAVFYIALVQLMWFFGIQGNHALEPIERVIYTPNAGINYAMTLMDREPKLIFSTQFFNTFVFVGGVGAVICLLIALSITQKDKESIRFTRLPMLISWFNISEVILYGLPVVLDPVYFIPFLLTPMVLTITTYLSMYFGLVPVIINGDVLWSFPVLFNAYITTQSWRGVAMQIFNIAIGTMIYIPFVRYSEKQKYSNYQKLMDELYHMVECMEQCEYEYLLEGRTNANNLACSLAESLPKAIKSDQMYMVYQPQVLDKEIVGAEALLRWNHPIYGMIPPPIVFAVAKESGSLKQLTKWCIDKVFEQVRDWEQKQNQGKFFVSKDFKISMNLSSHQLAEPMLLDYLKNKIEEYQINTRHIVIEITENISLNCSEEMLFILKSILDMGFEFSIDDFGMGHSSLIYLCSFKVHEVKIDGSLARSVLKNPMSREIISTIGTMCETTNMRCVVEYVETEEQVNLLDSMGSFLYQGYFFSPPLLPSEFEEFLCKNENKINIDKVAQNLR